jgi:hypothetical protein
MSTAATTGMSLGTGRPLPAAVVQQVETSPPGFRFAAGLCLTIPAFVFIVFMRPYLFNAFGVGEK